MTPAWIGIAMQEIGTTEVQGGENPRILEYHAATSLKASEDEVPWCSAFMNWVMQQCGMERSGSASARSWLGYGMRLDRFTPYSIVVLRRGNSKWQGHVGFAIEDRGLKLLVLGGNQKNSVCYAEYPKGDVIAYLWPLPRKDGSFLLR